MTTTKHMRTVLAAAAAGALVLGSAGGAIAAPKAKPQKLQSISIKGSAPIDLKDVTTTTAIPVRAKALGKKVEGATVTMTLAVYDKKVGGTVVDNSISKPITLTLRSTKTKNVSFFAGDGVVLGSELVPGIWTAEQVGVLAGEITKNGKAYICIASADLSTTDVDVTSKQVKKRLGAPGVKAVRDCVKVVNTPLAP